MFCSFSFLVGKFSRFGGGLDGFVAQFASPSSSLLLLLFTVLSLLLNSCIIFCKYDIFLSSQQVKMAFTYNLIVVSWLFYYFKIHLYFFYMQKIFYFFCLFWFVFRIIRLFCCEKIVVVKYIIKRSTKPHQIIQHLKSQSSRKWKDIVNQVSENSNNWNIYSLRACVQKI